MGRPRCDPIDAFHVLNALADGSTTPLAAYREYASTAARPYARSTWEVLIRGAERKTGERHAAEHEKEALTGLASADAEPDNASLDAASDAYWVERLQVKSRVLTTIHDNASLRVKGGALIVCDGENRLVYDAAARKPQAIVMTGWSGLVTVEAMRWACDHKVAIILLDWMRDFLTIVGAPPKPSAALIRSQVLISTES
jgi:hypothetical protein